jgi:hypothetical protein
MKWIAGALLAAALLLSTYAVYKTHQLEAAAKPHLQLLASRQ